METGAFLIFCRGPGGFPVCGARGFPTHGRLRTSPLRVPACGLPGFRDSSGAFSTGPALPVGLCGYRLASGPVPASDRCAVFGLSRYRANSRMRTGRAICVTVGAGRLRTARSPGAAGPPGAPGRGRRPVAGGRWLPCVVDCRRGRSSAVSFRFGTGSWASERAKPAMRTGSWSAVRSPQSAVRSPQSAVRRVKGEGQESLIVPAWCSSEGAFPHPADGLEDGSGNGVEKGTGIGIGRAGRVGCVSAQRGLVPRGRGGCGGFPGRTRAGGSSARPGVGRVDVSRVRWAAMHRGGTAVIACRRRMRQRPYAAADVARWMWRWTHCGGVRCRGAGRGS